MEKRFLAQRKKGFDFFWFFLVDNFFLFQSSEESKFITAVYTEIIYFDDITNFSDETSKNLN